MSGPTVGGRSARQSVRSLKTEELNEMLERFKQKGKVSRRRDRNKVEVELRRRERINVWLQ